MDNSDDGKEIVCGKVYSFGEQSLDIVYTIFQGSIQCLSNYCSEVYVGSSMNWSDWDGENRIKIIKVFDNHDINSKDEFFKDKFHMMINKDDEYYNFKEDILYGCITKSTIIDWK